VAYADFTLSGLTRQFKLTRDATTRLFTNVLPVKLRESFVAQLRETVPLALAISTEKARSEFIIAPVLLVIQIVLGGLTVLWKLPPNIITAHLGTALAIFATIITIAVMAGKPVASKEHPEETRKFARLAVTNALLVYGLMLSGSYVVGSGASLACTGWPLCTAQWWAISNHLADINALHRIFATIVGLVLIWTLISAWRRRKVAPGQAWIALAAGILFVAQAIVGGLIVLLYKPAFVAGLHLALATAVWGTLVLLAALATKQWRAALQGRRDGSGSLHRGPVWARDRRGGGPAPRCGSGDRSRPHPPSTTAGPSPERGTSRSG